METDEHYWQIQLAYAERAVEVAQKELARLALIGVDHSEASLD